MKRLLICPSERYEVRGLTGTAPLAAVPMLGQSLVEYWLSYLACAGTREVLVLTDERPEHIEPLVGDGARWGLEAKVVPESRELTPAQALLKYARELGDASATEAIHVLDHFPGLPDRPIFTSYADWFAALHGWMPRAITPDRVGMHELRPGVWVGSHTRISPAAVLRAPCWVGEHVFVDKEAVIGPFAIIEDNAFIEPAVRVARSWVGPETFVGRYAQVSNAFAFASTLIDWSTGAATQVAEPFVQCALTRPRKQPLSPWLAGSTEQPARKALGALWKQFLLRRESSLKG